MYDKIIITNLPSFYKVNLYNRLNRRCKILVIYTMRDAECRNNDFLNYPMEFDNVSLEGYSITRQFREVIHILRLYNGYSELILTGWDSILQYFIAFCTPKSRNAMVMESSSLETTFTGIKGILKRCFLTRISKGYPSGISQQKVFEKFNFKGKLSKTYGVGIFNYIKQPPYKEKNCINKFLYVGRFSHEKNLRLLIEAFNILSDKQLTLVGYGPQEDELKSISARNITFIGAVANKDLPQIYQQHDVFVLASISEPWGLVVEEALNNGLPVIVSDRVGCAAEIVTDEHGIIFQHDSIQELTSAIQQISRPEEYNRFAKAISKLDFGAIAQRQEDAYFIN